jgi:hypothetical protein
MGRQGMHTEWENNIKTDFKERGWECMDWIKFGSGERSVASYS